MRDLFPGFYNRTQEELFLFREQATFVLDTNMLLNVYRYQEETRIRFFEILEKFRERGRLWIPHQVIYEYLSNRVEVINQQIKVYSDVATVLNKAKESLEGLEHLKKKHSFINIEEIIRPSVNALGNAHRVLSESRNTSKNEFNALLKNPISDVYREKFARLFQSIVGGAYKKEQLISLYSQADKRFELQIPPGWKDKAKKTYGKYGDVIIWFQLLDYASLHNKPIIFVTDDKKSDWYVSIEEARTSVIGQKDNDHSIPRPELIQEMLIEAGVLLHIYDGDEFFEEATAVFKLTKEPKISEDVKRVTEQNTIEHKVSEVFVDPSVEEFINSLPVSRDRVRILLAMQRLKYKGRNQDSAGNQFQVPINPLDGELWILPVMDYRLIYHIKPDGDIIIIHGFQQEMGETENHTYEIAQREYERYSQNL